MKPLTSDQLYFYHDSLTIIMVVIWIVISWLGYNIKNNNLKTKISYCLIGFALLQEVMDYINRIFLDELYDFKLSTDLPLHFCIIGFYFSIFGIYMAISKKTFSSKLQQYIFDCAYVLGFSGALQALIAVDFTGINNMIGAFSLNWAHTLIILNVLWLIFAYGKRFSFKGAINAFIFMNLIIIPVGVINYILSSNYMFICSPPNVESSFFIGEWPIYLIWLEFIYFVYVLILLVPFKISEKYFK